MIGTDQCVHHIREKFIELKNSGQTVPDKTGQTVIELLGATFLADEPAIFGTVNQDYVNREIEWYKSRSLNVKDIPGGAPKAWVAAASRHGAINSNYGYLIWDKGNYNQYDNVLAELKNNPYSRRAVMIYTRPSIWHEHSREGMSDYICTNSSQYFIRDGKLISLVQMRSNDVIWGYKNDRAWQLYVQTQLADDLQLEVGDLIWHVGNLHVYSRHFDLIK
jgi:thymidylate synthase